MNTPPDTQHPGILNPVGHVMLAFRSEADLQRALPHMLELGVDVVPLFHILPQDMLLQVDMALKSSGPLASLGQELNLATAHRDMALVGCSFLLLPVADGVQGQLVADIARGFGAVSGQHYGQLVITELIDPGSDTQLARILEGHRLNAPGAAPAAV